MVEFHSKTTHLVVASLIYLEYDFKARFVEYIETRLEESRPLLL